MKNRFRGTRNSWFGQEELDSKRNGYGERLRDKTELTEEAEAIEETEMEGQLVQKVSNSTLGGSCETCSFVPSGSAGLSGQFLCFGKTSTGESCRSFWGFMEEKTL